MARQSWRYHRFEKSPCHAFHPTNHVPSDGATHFEADLVLDSNSLEKAIDNFEGSRSRIPKGTSTPLVVVTQHNGREMLGHARL
jgi:hypothetical protein